MLGRVADRGVVPLMTAKATSRAEGRPRPLGSPDGKAQVQTQSWRPLHRHLVRVNDAAQRRARPCSRRCSITLTSRRSNGRFGACGGGQRPAWMGSRWRRMKANWRAISKRCMRASGEPISTLVGSANLIRRPFCGEFAALDTLQYGLARERRARALPRASAIRRAGSCRTRFLRPPVA